MSFADKVLKEFQKVYRCMIWCSRRKYGTVELVNAI